jgi:hypothetical protein
MTFPIAGVPAAVATGPAWDLAGGRPGDLAIARGMVPGGEPAGA